MARSHPEASSNGRTADFGSADEGSNPSASAKHPVRTANQRAEVRNFPRLERTLLVALGNVSRPLLGELVAELGTLLGIAVGPAGAPQQRPQYAFNEARGQYHSTAILRRLAHARSGDVPVLGVTDVDLFVPDAPFVFGEADRDAKTAVVSIARLQQGADGRPVEPERLRRRLLVESIHEMGHLMGLSHCADARCAMYLSHKAADSDRKEPGLCAVCRGALGA